MLNLEFFLRFFL